DQRLDDPLLERALPVPAAPVGRPTLPVEPIPVRLVGGSLRTTRALVRGPARCTRDEIAERIPARRGPRLFLIPREPRLHAIPQRPFDQRGVCIRDMRLDRATAPIVPDDVAVIGGVT